MERKQENTLGEVKGFIKRLIIVLSWATILAGEWWLCLLMYIGELSIFQGIVFFPIIFIVVTLIRKVMMYLFLGEQHDATNSN